MLFRSCSNGFNETGSVGIATTSGVCVTVTTCAFGAAATLVAIGFGLAAVLDAVFEVGLGEGLLAPCAGEVKVTASAMEITPANAAETLAPRW